MLNRRDFLKWLGLAPAVTYVTIGSGLWAPSTQIVTGTAIEVSQVIAKAGGVLLANGYVCYPNGTARLATSEDYGAASGRPRRAWCEHSWMVDL